MSCFVTLLLHVSAFTGHLQGRNLERNKISINVAKDVHKKFKVKFILEQARKGQTGSKGIALLSFTFPHNMTQEEY